MRLFSRRDLLAGYNAWVSRLLEGDEGVFWVERHPSGSLRWACGWGQKKSCLWNETSDTLHFMWADYTGKHACAYCFDQGVIGGSSMGSGHFSHQDFSYPQWHLNLKESLAACSHRGKESFIAAVEHAKKEAHKGNLWVINLSHALSGELDDHRGMWGAFRKMLEGDAICCGGIVWTAEQKFCSFSPELFLRQKNNILSTYPIKGTGTKSYLRTCEKEISELAMVTDLLRNDLGQIAERVWVPHERVLTRCGSFYHAHAEIHAELAAKNFGWKSYARLLPAGSISGAPKHRAGQLIQDLEGYDREFYTGTFGCHYGKGDSVWGILIRTLFCEENHWKFPVGAGITALSDPETEWQETLRKAENLLVFCDQVPYTISR